MRVYDCCIMNAELDLLEARMEILKDVVDFFVVVEADKSFSGHPKPLWYSVYKKRFERFHEQIIYIPVRDMPLDVPSRWHREAHQREAILRGLLGAEPGDLIIVGDVDEIPKPEAIAWASQFDRTAFSLKTYYYNLVSVSQQYLVGTTTMKWGANSTPNTLRDQRSQWPLYPEGSWHFSFFGGVDFIQHKIRSFSHSEYDTYEWLNETRIENCIANGIDPFQRSEYPLVYEPLNNTLPAYIIDNLEKYTSWLPEHLRQSFASTAPT